MFAGTLSVWKRKAQRALGPGVRKPTFTKGRIDMFAFLKRHKIEGWPLIYVLLLSACTPVVDIPPSLSVTELGGQATAIIHTPTSAPASPTHTQPSKITVIVPTISTRPPNPTSVTVTMPTDTPIPTVAPDGLLKGSLVAFKIIDRQTNNQGILLLDLSTGVNRQFWSATVAGELIGLNWRKDGCQLYGSFRTLTGVEVVTFNLSGDIVEKVQITGLAGVNSGWTVAPSGEQIAFVAHSGAQDLYYSEFQDVEVISTHNVEVPPLALSNHGWTLQPAWSPDGHRLAYSNLDSNGVRQLYYSSPDGETSVQLTDFPGGVERIEAIQWSPDSEKIAFSVVSEGQISLWSVNSDGGGLQEAYLGEYIPNGEPWWGSDNETYAILTQQWLDNHPVSEGDAILWIDSVTGQVVYQLLLSSLEESNSEIVFPAVTGENIGFWGEQVVLFNLLTQSLTTLTSSPFVGSVQLYSPFTLIVPGPVHFSDESKCR